MWTNSFCSFSTRTFAIIPRRQHLSRGKHRLKSVKGKKKRLKFLQTMILEKGDKLTVRPWGQCVSAFFTLTYIGSPDFIGDRLWVDIYEPMTEVSCAFVHYGERFFSLLCSGQAELAVHVRKVEDVRRWFTEAFEGGPSGKMRRYRVRSPFLILYPLTSHFSVLMMGRESSF